MPIKTYKDTQNATLLLGLLLSLIFGIISTKCYYSSEKTSLRDRCKRDLTISWSIFGSISFLMLVFSNQCVKDKVKYPAPIVTNKGTDIEIVQYPV